MKSKNNKLIWKIATRYLISPRRFHFISVIILISILGIMVGVASLISVISIFNGFQDLTEKQIVGFDPHIRIYFEEIDDEYADSVAREMKQSIPEINTAVPIISGRCIAVKENKMQVFTVFSLDSGKLNEAISLDMPMIFGDFSISGTGDLPGVLLGAGIADKLDVIPGDTIFLMSPSMIERSIRTYRRTNGIKTYVRGIYQTNINDFDLNHSFLELSAGKKLFGKFGNITQSIDIRLDALDQASFVSKKIKEKFPAIKRMDTWRDLNEDLFNVMEFERIVAFTILSLIVLIAVFNVLASLSMTVVEKRPDIGIMRAMGATKDMIRRIFIYEGVLVGLISSVLGTLLGSGVILGQQRFGWLKLDPTKYIVDAIPVSLHMTDIVIIFGFSLLFSFLATLYPSGKAASTVVIEAVRDE